MTCPHARPEGSIGPQTSKGMKVFWTAIAIVVFASVLHFLNGSHKEAAETYARAAIEKADIRGLAKEQVSNALSEALSKALSRADIEGRVDQAVLDNDIPALAQRAARDAVNGETAQLQVKEALEAVVRNIVLEVLHELYEEASAPPAPESGPAETPSEVEQ